MFALLCMYVVFGVKGLEGGSVGTSVCCMCLKLMPYVVIMKEKQNKTKRNKTTITKKTPK